MVSAANISLQIIYGPLAPLCPRLPLEKSGLLARQVQQPGLPGFQCIWQPARAASPSPPTLGGALHHRILMQTGVGGSWSSPERELPGTDSEADATLDFMQHFANCEN